MTVHAQTSETESLWQAALEFCRNGLTIRQQDGATCLLAQHERGTVRITEQTVLALNQALLRHKVPSNQGLRLIQAESGYILVLDAPRPGDAVFDCLGAPVLMASPRVVAQVVGTILDEYIDLTQVAEAIAPDAQAKRGKAEDGREVSVAKTFKQLVAEAREGAQTVSPEEAKQRLEQDKNTLVVDVRDAQDLSPLGIIPGALNVSLGTLPLRADQELPEQFRNPELQDRSRPIITTCGGGGQAALGAKLLRDMGFQNVSILEGGTTAWKNAGLPTEQPGESR